MHVPATRLRNACAEGLPIFNGKKHRGHTLKARKTICKLAWNQPCSGELYKNMLILNVSNG